MKLFYTTLLILFITVVSFSQTKYMVYFKDKGLSTSTSLMKSSLVYEKAVKELSPRAIERRKKVMGENYITSEDLPVNEDYIAQIESLGINIINKLKWFNAVSCYLSDEQLLKIQNYSFVQKIETVKTLSRKIDVEQSVNEIELNTNLQKANSLDYGSSYTQNKLSDIPAVHDLGIKGDSVIIGILDSGFRWKEVTALKTMNVLAEHDFVNGDDNTANESGDASNQDSHGTSVFSIMAGYAPGNLIGPAYGASFLLAKTEDIRSEKHVEEDNYAAALEWMEAQGVDITSSSLGYTTFDTGQNSYTYSDMNGNTTIVVQAANKAFERGVSTFTAAGNEGNLSWHYISSPGDAYNIITVGAVNSSNKVMYFSSRGPTSDGRIKPEITAMGDSVCYASASNKYGTGNGTSYATPIAAGIAGLLKSAYPNLTNKQIREIFIACGDSADSPNNNRGYGLISAKRVICYPNIDTTDGVVLNKIFINSSESINTSSVTAYYRFGTGEYQSATMNFDGNYKYTYSLPASQSSIVFQFYFTYNTVGGTEVREPEDNSVYSFNYGEYKVISDVDETSELPEGFYLSQNYPNPFNPETVIKYKLPESGDVSLKIYDILGREVATLVNEMKSSGTYEVKFNGNKLSSGVYFYSLKLGNYVNTKKMLLIK
jgi:serine protease AprX